MKTQLDITDQIEFVKTAAATKMFWDGVKTYGTKEHALRAYDSRTIDEAIEMLKNAVRYSVFKRDGEVVVEVTQ
jgi:hypothetical protein